MTEQEQRIAIAKACGWKDPNIEEPIQIAPDGTLWTAIPNYPRDLNAMHEAEKTLNPAERLAFVYELERICFDTYSVFATAAQRAEAFSRVRGL